MGWRGVIRDEGGKLLAQRWVLGSWALNESTTMGVTER
jgi:hypothetical protein